MMFTEQTKNNKEYCIKKNPIIFLNFGLMIFLSDCNSFYTDFNGYKGWYFSRSKAEYKNIRSFYHECIDISNKS